MDRLSWLLSVGVLVLFAVGSAVAWAQGVPDDAVSVLVGGSGVTFDLGSMTTGGALVVCTMLVLRAGGIPFTITVLHRGPESEDTGSYRLVKVE